MLLCFLVSCCWFSAVFYESSADLSAVEVAQQILLDSSTDCTDGYGMHFYNNVHQQHSRLCGFNVRIYISNNYLKFYKFNFISDHQKTAENFGTKSFTFPRICDSDLGWSESCSAMWCIINVTKRCKSTKHSTQFSGSCRSAC